MSIAENSAPTLPDLSPADERQAAYLRRNHQQLQHFINRMLNLLEVPDKAARAVSGLQGMLNGRTDFPVFKAHHLTARQLNYRGADENADTFMGRVLDALDEAERRCGRRFFRVTRADGVTQRMTSYDADYLTPAAVWGLLEARRSPLWKTKPAAAVDAVLDAAIAKLPAREVEAPEGEGAALTDDAIIKGIWTKVENLSAKNLERVVAAGGDPVREVARIQDRLMKLAIAARKQMLERDRREAGVDDEARQREFDAAVWGEAEAAPAEAAWRPPCQADEGGRGAAEAEGGGEGAYRQFVGMNPENPQQSEAVSEPDLLEWALWWASQGIRVLPLHSVFDGICSCRDGTECRSAGKHPRTRNGVDDATTNEEQIRAWWERWPGANVGIAMGGHLRLVALDSDPRSGGDASVCDLVEAHGDGWLETFTVKTGGLGHHFIFRLPEGVEACRGKLAPGIDVKAEGGYLVAAPSEHASRRRYSIEKAVEIQEAPTWLVEELTRPASQSPQKAVKYQERQARGSPRGELILQGERNRRVFEIGCAIWGQGKATDVHDLYNQLLQDVYPRCEVTSQDPFTPEDVWKVAHSVTRYPRGVPAVAG